MLTLITPRPNLMSDDQLDLIRTFLRKRDTKPKTCIRGHRHCADVLHGVCSDDKQRHQENAS